MQSAFLLSEDQAIVELAVDIPFGMRGREIRLVPAAWAVRLVEEFRSLGIPAPDDLHPLAPSQDSTDAVAQHIVGTVEGLSSSSLGREILRGSPEHEFSE